MATGVDKTLQQVFVAVKGKYESLAEVSKIEMQEKDVPRVMMLQKILAEAERNLGVESMPLPKAFGKAAVSLYSDNTEHGPQEFMHATMAAQKEAERIEQVFLLVGQSKISPQEAVDRVYNPFIRTDLGFDVPLSQPA